MAMAGRGKPEQETGSHLEYRRKDRGNGVIEGEEDDAEDSQSNSIVNRGG